MSSSQSPAIQSIVPLIFILFIIPGTLYGFLSGRFTQARQVIEAMTENMRTMGYYLVVVFLLRSLSLSLMLRIWARCWRWRAPLA